MSENFSDARNPSNRHVVGFDRGDNQATEQQVPHSGIHHDERPVDEFDKTPLPEAVERGLVNPTPDSPAGLRQPEPVERERAVRAKSHKKYIIGGAAFFAGAAVVAGSVIGIKAVSDAPTSQPPETDPKATSAAPTPEASAAPEQQLTVESFEISGDLSPEDAATVLVNDRLSAWATAGATQGTVDGYLAAGGSSVYTDSVAEANALLIADALFVSGWQSDEVLAHYVGFEQQNNAGVLEMWILTGQSGLPQDREPYERSISVDSVTVDSATDANATLSVAATEHDNSDENTVGVGERISQTESQVVDGNKISGSVELQKVDGTWKVAAIAWSARE